MLPAAPTAEVDRVVRDGIERVARAPKSAGAKVAVEPELPFDLAEAHHTYLMLLRAAFAASVTDAKFADATRRRPTVRDDDWDYAAMLVRAWMLPHREWHAWNARQMAICEGWREWFGRFDVLLCPAAATTAFPHVQQGERWERMVDVDGTPPPTTTRMFRAGLGGMAGLPATVIPAGPADDGLPTGAQLIGARGADLDLLAIEKLLEKEGFAFRAPGGYD